MSACATLTRIAKLRVPVRFVLVPAFAWLSRPTVTSLAAGLPISILGLLLRAWAAGHLSKDESLATSGPYGRTRNPLYLGSLLVAAGIAIASRSIALAVLFGVVFLLIYLPAITAEEEHLRKLFPSYAAYAAKVPRLRPRLRGFPAGQSFRFAQYVRNREYEALLEFLAAVLWLCVKMWIW